MRIRTVSIVFFWNEAPRSSRAGHLLRDSTPWIPTVLVRLSHFQPDALEDLLYRVVLPHNEIGQWKTRRWKRRPHSARANQESVDVND
jgi:hypothetical protein